MKQIFTLISALCLSSLTYGQAVEQGNIKIDLGVGGGAYGGKIVFEYQGESDEETLDPGVSAYVNLNVAYSITDMFSLGINYKKGSLIVSEFESEKNKFNDIGLQARAYVLNKDKFTIDANASFGLAYLNQQDDYSGFTSSNKWNGTDIGLGVGFNFFFTDNIGMNAGIQYNMYTLNLKSIEYDGESEPLPADFSYKIKYNGPEFKLGLTVKI